MFVPVKGWRLPARLGPMLDAQQDSASWLSGQCDAR
jgi:hypothetical protein